MKTEEDVVIVSSEVNVENDSEVDAGGSIKILDAQDTYENETEDKQFDIEIGVKVGNAYVDTAMAAKALVDAEQTLEKSIAKHTKLQNLLKEGKASQKAVDLAKAQIALATTGVVTASTSLALSIAGAASAAATSLGTGTTVSGYENTSYTSTTTKTSSSTSKGSSFTVGGNATFKAEDTFEMQGSEVTSTDGDLSVEANEIELRAGVSTYDEETKMQSGNQNASVGNGGVSVGGGYNQSNNNVSSTTYTNSVLGAANGNISIKTEGDTKLLGGNIVGETTTIDIGGNLIMETMQDTYEEVGDSFGVNLSGGAAGVSSASASMGITDINTKTSNEVTGIVQTSTYDDSKTEAENLNDLLESDSVNVAGDITDNTEKEDYSMTDADFDGELTVPIDLLTKEGRANVKDAVNNLGANLGKIGSDLGEIVKPIIDKTTEIINKLLGNKGVKNFKSNLSDGGFPPVFIGTDANGNRTTLVEGDEGYDALLNAETNPNSLDPSTVGNNLFGLSYPGGDNPKDYSDEFTYSVIPSDLSEYPAIGHDRRYDNLKTEGVSGLLMNTKAIGADWKFVSEEFSIFSNNSMPIKTRIYSGTLGVGLGVAAFPKTIFKLSTPNGIRNIVIDYNLSNQGVTNNPSKPIK